MEITIGEIIEALGPLRKIFTTEQPIKVAYTLRKLLGKVEAEIKDIENSRTKIISKYGDLAPNGSFKIRSENIEVYTKEMEELSKIVTQLDVQPLPLELLDGVRLSPLEVMRLEKFIEEPVGVGLTPAQKENKEG